MFTVSNAIDQLTTWTYYGAISLMQEFMKYLGNMGAELFDNQYIQAIMMFFQMLASALFLVGMILAFFEYAISIESGKASMKDTLLSILKGMAATALFTIIPVRLYQLCVDTESAISSVMNNTMLNGIMPNSGTTDATAASTPSLVNGVLDFLTNLIVNNPLSNPVGAIGSAITNSAVAGAAAGQQHVPTAFNLLFMIAFAYGFLKVMFGNIKRGGILLIQICVCSLYIFSLVRGYSDAFVSWCKQIVALCFTAFIQNLMLVGGLLIFPNQMVVGVGLMLAAAEVPRIAQAFGMETSMKANVSSIAMTTNSVMSLGRTLMAGGI
jgi:hypothetical protein